MISRLGSVVLPLLSLTISFEVCSFVYLHYIVGFAWTPEYLSPASSAGPRWLTEDRPWGTWHVANQVSRQKSRCFSVALRSNSYGARDRERAMVGDPHRTIVLGDSFAEGWGVESYQRMSDLLEARFKREFLNFGAENDFGPLQYQILYEQLASHFSHDQVLIMFLPDNDFTDNDSSYWATFRADYDERYRPYYQILTDGTYRPLYPIPAPADELDGTVKATNPVGWLRRNVWSSMMFRYIRARLGRSANYSGYFDFTSGQLKAVLWSFAKIKELAGDRRVTIAVIPRLNEFSRVGKSDESPLIEALTQFGHEHNIEIVDLLKLMPPLQADIKRYYLSCDGHWSAEGNAVAAAAIAATLWPEQKSRTFDATGAAH
jgi:lysophospholipase L1-like esterase